MVRLGQMPPPHCLSALMPAVVSGATAGKVINKHEKRTLWIVRAVVFKFNHRINVLNEIKMRRWTVLYAFIVYRYIVLPEPPGRAVRPSAQ